MHSDPTQPFLEKPSFPLPEYIGKYKIDGLLAKGGMSILYLAQDPSRDEPIVIKILSPQFVNIKEHVTQFLHEAHLISLSDHPNIVKLYDYGTWEGGLYIAMEFVQGISLRKILTHQPLPLKKAIEVTLQIAHAVCHLHTHGIIHGDLKPENIIMTEKGTIKLIDFGIAQIIQENIKILPDRIIGTPMYMSPEQLNRSAPISFQSDIYSLAIIAYELTLGKITHGKIILSLAPKGMQKILSKALQKQPKDRYKDIVDFIVDLCNYLKSGIAEQDKQGTDYFFELFEEIEEIQKNLITIDPPDWPDIEIGISYIYGVALRCLYNKLYDISPTKKLIVFAETQKKGPQGIIDGSILENAIQLALQSGIKDFDLLCFIKKITKNIFIHEELLFLFAQIDTKTKKITYAHNGYGTIFQYKDTMQIFERNENTKDGITIGIIEHAYDQRILFLAYPTKGKDLSILSAQMKKAFNESCTYPCQHQSEVLLRKIRVYQDFFTDDHPIGLNLIATKK